MGIQVHIDGVSREIVEEGESEWGKKTSDLLSTLSNALNSRVSLSKKETISGRKIFLDSPVVPIPIADDHAARKADLEVVENQMSAIGLQISEDIRENERKREKIIPLDGSVPFTGDVNMQGHKIRNLGSGLEDGDAINKIQLNEAIEAFHTLANNHSAPIGTIMGVHPLAPVPDSSFWKLCDGNGTLGERFLEHASESVPDLTEHCFLMGSTREESMFGGNNSMQLELRHLPDHTHLCRHTHQPGTLSTSRDGIHQHYFYVAGTTSIFAGTGNLLSQGVAYTSSTHYVSTGSAGEHTHRITGEIAEYEGFTQGAQGANREMFDNRPRYFGVKFYIRVN